MRSLVGRRIFIALGLYFLGALGYFLLSRSSVEVRMITALEHLLLVLSVSVIFWLQRISLLRRFLIVIGIVLLFSVAFTYLDVFFIGAIIPLHPIYFLMAFVSFLCEAFAFLGLAWLIDRGLVMKRTSLPMPGEDRTSRR